MADLGEGAGFLVLSTGHARRRCLWECLASIKRHYPDAPIQVISDAPTDEPTTLVKDREGQQSRFYKTQAYSFSPFNVTVMIDDDAVVHRPFGSARSLLGEGAEIAMARDWAFPTLGAYAARKAGRGRDVGELVQWAKAKPERSDFPYFNSGVMVFRNTAKVGLFFSAWHQLWLRWQRKDQTVLPMALADSGAAFSVLVPAMNHKISRELTNEDLASDRFILHLFRDKVANAERYGARGPGLAPAPERWKQFGRMTVSGLCDPQTYLALAAALTSYGPCRFLVFGAGADSAFWQSINRGGETLIVEDDAGWAEKVRREGVQVLDMDYPTKRGKLSDRSRLYVPPAIKDFSPTFVFVDGPRGQRSYHPGRELPIRWAAQLQPEVLFLHDFDRVDERSLVRRYIPTPDMVIAGRTAVWLRAAPGRVRDAVIDVL